MSCLANQTCHRHAINSEVGAYVDDCHSRPQPVSKKIHLLFEPAFLFEQDVGRDRLQTFRNRERYGIRKVELDYVQCRTLYWRPVAGIKRGPDAAQCLSKGVRPREATLIRENDAWRDD